MYLRVFDMSIYYVAFLPVVLDPCEHFCRDVPHRTNSEPKLRNIAFKQALY